MPDSHVLLCKGHFAPIWQNVIFSNFCNCRGKNEPQGNRTTKSPTCRLVRPRLGIKEKSRLGLREKSCTDNFLKGWHLRSGTYRFFQFPASQTGGTLR